MQCDGATEPVSGIVYIQVILYYSGIQKVMVCHNLAGGGDVMYVCVCTKRACVRNTEPKACTVGIYSIHKNLGICTV